MSQPISQSKKAFKEAALFALCYITIFWVFIGEFSDGIQTTNVFRLMAILLSIILIVAYVIVITLFIRSGKQLSYFEKAVWLYFLVEVIVLVFAGKPALFGLYQKYIAVIPDGDPYQLQKFRVQSNFYISLSALVSAVFFFCFKKLFSRKPVATQ